MTALKRLLFGKPIPTAHAMHHRLPKFLALPVFASDALSSVAYATQEIIVALVASLGVAATGYGYGIGIGWAIAALLIIVAASYRQTIMAYPTGGGSYIVSRENLGTLPSLVAGASLLIDYILTVSVSVSAGVEALTSAYHSLGAYNVQLAIGIVLLIALANLRGLKESGIIFALPTYGFILGIMTTVGLGIFQKASGVLQAAPIESAVQMPHLPPALFLFALLHAFASGCTALTGVEAISDGVPAFQPPESKNAAATLGILAVLLTTMFLGLTFLAHWLNIANLHQIEHETVVSQIARAVFHGRTPMYYYIQAVTAAILVLAANTAFADFPRLCFFMASDGFLPKQLSVVGERLVFNNGILVLTTVACVLIGIYHANTHHLIPLYCVGVFTSFTLSQAAMVRRWRKLRTPGWQRSAMINATGATVCFVVLVVLATTKFVHGAWMVVVAIPALVGHFYYIHAHYMWVKRALALEDDEPDDAPVTNAVVVVLTGAHAGLLHALRYARTLSSDVQAVFINTDPREAAKLQANWDEYGQGIPLAVVELKGSSYGRVLKKHLQRIRAAKQATFFNVVIPEYVRTGTFQAVLSSWYGFKLKLMLLWEKHMVVTNVRYFDEDLEKTDEELETRLYNTVIFLVSNIHRGMIPAIKYSKNLNPNARAIYIEVRPEDTPRIREQWEKWGEGLPLVILESPFRTVVQPLLDYLEQVDEERPDDIVTAVLPEFVPPKFWQLSLHGQTGLMLKYGLLWRRNVVLTNVRYFLEPERTRRMAAQSQTEPAGA